MTSRSGGLKTAGIIVIGDEILKGYTLDRNSQYLSSELLKLGVRVARISTIPDDVDEIAEEVGKFSRRFDHVLTSGGIGPTHDDVTFEGVGRAFGDVCSLHPQLESFARDFFKLPSEATLASTPQLKLAFIPSQAELLWGRDEKGRRALYPSVRHHNVVVFPGIPNLLRKAFAMLHDHFRNDSASLHHRRIFLSSDEFSIANILSKLQEELRPRGLSVGSYPKIHHPYYRVKVTLDSVEEEAVKEAEEKLRDQLSASILSYDETPLQDPALKMTNFLATAEPELVKLVRETLREIDAVVEEMGDSQKFCVCFDGGKDCTALLHLVWLRLRAVKPMARLRALYIRPRDPFPQMETFVQDTVKRYDLDLLQVPGPIKQAMERLKAEDSELVGIFMGTRTSDPNWRGQRGREWTDEGWPSFLRLNPILEWRYAHVWTLLRGLWLPYSPLYDEGYTSIGERHNTQPNPTLAFQDGFGLRRYKPAHHLLDESLERAGRGSIKSK